MTTALGAEGIVSEDEFWSLVEMSDERLEYTGGRVYAMGEVYSPARAMLLNAQVGQSENSIWAYIHARLVMRLLALLENALEGKHCTALGNNFPVHVEFSGHELMPDAVVHCGEPRLGTNGLTLLNPVVVFEVLSPITENYDRSEKFDLYAQIPTLNDYVLISQDAVKITHYSRQSAEWSRRTFTKLEEVLTLSLIEVELSLRELYGGLNVSLQLILFPEPESD